MRKISNEQFNNKYYIYKNMIYNIAYTYVHNITDADDIVQDVFMKYLKCDTIFETNDNEKYWLIRVAINTSKTFLKSAWKKKVSFEDENVMESLDVSDADESTLFKNVCQLSSKYKDVIILHYYEDMSINEITKVLKITSSNVKKRLERARKLLREKEKKNG